MPRLLTWREKGIGNLSMMMDGARVCCELVRVDLEQGLGIIALKLQEDPAHPALDVFHAGDDGGWVWRRCRHVCHRHSSERGSHDDRGLCPGGGGSR